VPPLCSRLDTWWFQYEITSGSYVLEWWEWALVHLVTLTVLVMLARLLAPWGLAAALHAFRSAA
jgi:hypothetical protein